jgi:hypothetical protein
VRLGLVGFAADDAGGALGSAGDVEVAQRGVAQTVDAVEPGEHLLDNQLGFAVDVGGVEARGLLNGDRLRLAVYSSRGRKDQAFGSLGQDGFQKRKRGGGVVAEIDFRGPHRFAGFDESGEMKDCVKRGAGIGGRNEQIFDQRPVGQITLDEFDSLGHLLAPAVAQIIEYNGIVAFGGQQRGDGATDVSGTTGNQNLHKILSFHEHFGLG